MKKVSVLPRIMALLITTSLVIGSSANVYASFSDGDFSNEDSFSEEFFAPNDEDIYDSPVLFDNEPEYQEEFTDEAQATGTQPEPDEMVENNIAFQETESQIASQVKKLLTNTNSSGRPLSEYNDPINITADFSQSAEGVVQNFFRQYGNISSKNRVWRMKYEEVLVDLLSDESFIKLYKDARLGDLEDFTYSILGEIAGESSEALTSAAGKIVKIQRSTLQDMIKAQIANDTEKIYILTIIEDHTDDKNLKTACKNCMSHYFSASMDSIYEVLVDIAVSNGIKKAVAVETITNQILNQKLKQTYLTKMLQELSLGTVASTVMEILLIKDALSFLTGINARVDAYLKTVCLNYIYEATATAYGSSVNGAKVGSNEDIKNLYTMFNFALQVKQEAYKSMPSIYISSTWKKIIETDPYMKLNISMIKTFTIDNYKKVELGKLTPKCTASSITVNLNGKRNYPLSGISYLATIGYASKDKKIVSINSSGVMKGVKEGTTYVGCVVQQYGENYNLICKVNVVQPSISLNKKNATLYTTGNNATLQLEAIVKGQSKTVTWTSSDSSIASVDKNGKVTAKSVGTTIISATANGMTAQCTINVRKRISGTCGTNLNWIYDAGSKKLIISGKGKMYDLPFDKIPWKKYEIKSVDIKPGVTNVCNYAFFENKILQSVKIPNTVTSIGRLAFADCRNLKKIVIPKSVKRIENSAFDTCEKLSSITIQNGVEYIGFWAFVRCKNLNEITIPNSVFFLGSGALGECTQLKKVILSDNIKNIFPYLFSNCKSLSEIIIPPKVAEISGNSFYNCTSLKKIYFKGNAPKFEKNSHTFNNVIATAYYPENNRTWTSDIRQNYYGKITWKKWNPTE